MAVWEFNRGEWTEAYVFLRLLGEGRIYGATTELAKDDSTYIDIVNVIRDEPDKLLIFERFVSEEIAYVQLYKDEERLIQQYIFSEMGFCAHFAPFGGRGVFS